MSILSNVELLSVELGTIKLSSDSKKIKFKQESYSNIIKKYTDFCKNAVIPNENPETNEMSNQENIQPISTPESIVVHIENKKYEELECQHARLKNRIFMLKVEGRLLPQLVGKRALKIKDSMKQNMLSNNAISCNTDIDASKVEEHKVEEETQSEEIKVTKNGAANAKIEKYSEDSYDTNENIIKPMQAKPIIDIVNDLKNINNKFKLVTEEDVEKPTAISPTVIEKNTARPISVEENDNKKENTDFKGIVAPSQLKEYLAKTEQLKAQLSEAQKNVETAKADAIKAKEKAAAEKKEAEAVQEELMETIKKLEKHNEELEKEKLAKEEEARKYSEESQEYIAKEKEYSSMQQEYKNTINEMLAAIG